MPSFSSDIIIPFVWSEIKILWLQTSGGELSVGSFILTCFSKESYDQTVLNSAAAKGWVVTKCRAWGFYKCPPPAKKKKSIRQIWVYFFSHCDEAEKCLFFGIPQSQLSDSETYSVIPTCLHFTLGNASAWSCFVCLCYVLAP